MELSWNGLLTKHHPPVIEFWGTLLVQLVFFWLPSLFYLALDHVAPNFSQRHKLQPRTKQPTPAELKDCLKVVFRNQLFSALIHISLLSLGGLADGKPTYRFDASLPSLDQVILDVLACVFLREVLFYYAHRILHFPSIYPKIHKIHHRFTAPVALAAQYAHPVEHFFANSLPISIPPMILHAMYGYDFLSGIAKKHDAHHEKFLINFGTIGLLDWIHGTDERTRQKKVA